MAVLFVCSVMDSAMQAFARPIFVQSVGLAMRSFQDEVNRDAPDNPLNRHSEDFTLYCINLFDEESGKFIGGIEDFRVLTRGKDAKNAKEE